MSATEFRPSRLTITRLRRLAAELPDRYTTMLPHLQRARLLTGAHLDRILSDPAVSTATTARVRRRVMTRLTRLGLVTPLHRRVGGARSGSAGHIYTLTSAGYRFLTIHQEEPVSGRIRHAPAPGVGFLDHALAISGLYVDLISASRARRAVVDTFATEPDCWHPTDTVGWLHPDAYLVLNAGNYRDYWWLEVDRGTEPLRRVRAKCRDYLDHTTDGGVGPDQVPPRILFTTPDQPRADAIRDAIAAMLPGATYPETALITAITHQEATDFLISELHTNPTM